MAPPTTDEVLGLLERISALFGPLVPEPREMPRYYLEIFALFDRTRSLVGAVRLLVENGFAHEAVMLTRPLVTDSLAFAELASVDGDRRAELALGWELGSRVDLRGVVLEAHAEGEAWADDLMAGIDKERRQIEEYAQRNGFRTSYWRPDKAAKALARKHDRVTEWLDVRVTQHFVHGSTFATSQRYQGAGAGDVVLVGGPSKKAEQWAVMAGCSAAQSGLLSVRDFCVLCDLELPSEWTDLWAEVESFAARWQDAADSAGGATE